MKQGVELSLPPVIILAGGRSERYGSPKGLAKVGDETLLFTHISTYSQVGARIVVVLGYYTEPYIADIERANVQLKAKPPAGYAVNHAYDLGPFSSILCGLEALAGDVRRGVFVQPVDSGNVSATIYRELFIASENGAYSVIPEWQGKGGHPVVVSADLVARLQAIDPKSEFARLDYQLRAEPAGRVRRLPVSNPDVLVNRNVPG